MTLWATLNSEDSESEWVNHGTNCGTGGEFTVCSQDQEHWEISSYDGFGGDYIDVNHPPIQRKCEPNEITCPECIKELNHIEENFYKKNGKWFQKMMSNKSDYRR